MWRNTQDRYGWISITLHWLVALAVLGLFCLGLWMVDLGYYDPWYRRAPELHKSIGSLLFGIMLLRLAWRYSNPRPEPIGSPCEQKIARLVHTLFYVLLFTLVLSGYLISTADGRPIQVFQLFTVPATISGIDRQEDIAGEVHKILAYTVMGLAALHALAALKHHFIDGDHTLKRVLTVRNTIH